MIKQDFRRGSVVKYIFKAIGLLLIFGTIGLLLWRIFSSGDPQSMKTLYVDDELHAAWQTAEDEGREMMMYTQEYDNITRAQHNYGYFSVTQTLFIEDTDEVQLTFRYNNSTIRHLKEDYGLENLPDRAEDLFDVSLVVIYDLTPADKSDNEKQTFHSPDETYFVTNEAGESEAETYDINVTNSVKRVRYFPQEVGKDTNNLYNYRKFVFDDIGLTNQETPILGIFVDVYYKGDINYQKDSYGTLSIYNYAFDHKNYNLTGKDKDALEDYCHPVD